MDSKQLGNFGEEIAFRYLKNRGYKILDRNYKKELSRFFKGEIDLVAEPRGNIFDILRGKKDKIIHFIEVKTSIFNESKNYNFQPEDRVNFLKQKKIIRFAECWLNDHKTPLDSAWQVDVMGILFDTKSRKARIRHFKNIAF